MKVSLLSSYDSGGGAGIAARRLLESLRGFPIDVELLVREKTTSNAGIRLIEGAGCDPIMSEFRDEFSRYRTPVSNTMFSFLYPSPLIASTYLLGSDVVNIHWVADFFNAVDLSTLANAGIPVVITLHDEWTYTGGCHYTAGCSNFTQNCEHCPQLREQLWHIPPLVLKRKRSNYGCLHIVAPSEWIAGQARRSSLLANNPVEVIHNPINLQCFEAGAESSGKSVS